MKKVFTYILLFYYIVHFIIPGFYFISSGNFNTYTDIDDKQGILKGFILNSVMVLGTILVIQLLPEKRKSLLIEPKFFSIAPLFYFSIIFSVLYFFLRGGFEGKLSGSMAGSLFSYLALFLNPYMILLCVLFYQRRQFNLVILFLIYLVYTTFTGSRSGFISLFIIILMYPKFKNYTIYKKSIKKVLFAFLLISPVLFLLATVLIREASIIFTPDMIMRMIMGRMSFLETSMLPIHYKDLGDPLELFYDKYGLINQLKIITDTLFPGSLFGSDVMPNQYYRAAFMGYSEDFVLNVYTSINITLPIYLYMYMGGFFSCFFSILILFFYYCLLRKCINNMFLFVPLLASLYHLLYFFDWVMWFLQFFTFMLTSFTVYGFVVLRQSFVQMLKKRTEITPNNLL